jgi:hypothetical protein
LRDSSAFADAGDATMRRGFFALPLVGLLAACGGTGREQRAADACAAEVHAKLGNRPYELDTSTLAATARAESADTYQLAAPILFGKGLPSEYRQTIDCRVRFEADQPSVIFLQFNWTLGGQ